MDATSPLRAAIQIVGLTTLARALGVTHQAVRKWEQARRMPRTEWTGETRYGERIEALTEGRVTRAQLLEAWPKPASEEPVSQHATAA